MIDIIIRGVQAFKIIPEFISQYKQASSASPASQMMNIKSIISLYYIQNIFFMLLSCWILYLLFSKLNMFIDSIYLLIIYFGILGSILFYPLVPFNLSTAKDVKNYPI
jgi:type II secretory pathway component PulF